MSRRLAGVRARFGALAVLAALTASACGGTAPRPPRPGGDSAPSAAASSAGTTPRPGAAPSSGAAPGSTPPRPSADPSPRCSNVSRLAGWPDRRLAMLTITVPVPETATAQAAPEVAAGAGGVLLFGSAAPGDLGDRLAALRARVPGHLGLLVMTDEEGGGVQRMANLVGSLPWPAWMGAHWSPARIEQEVARVAARMSAAGVNMDLAPVADVDGRDVPPSASNPDGLRSFGGDPALVSRDTVAYLRGLRAGGVIAVVKHFPGLGGASGNTDDGPAQTVPWPAQRAVGLPPFAAAVAAGVPGVMAANATVPGLAGVPAGLSPAVIGTMLRGRLHFGGLVLTDSLTAKAVSAAGYGVPQAAVQALRAGADMVMFGLVPDVGAETSAIASAITGAVAQGVLPRTRLVDAARAVLAVRGVDLCAS